MKLYVVAVAPEIAFQVAPLSVLLYHCTVGAGLPVAAAVKLAVWPAFTVVLTGWVVTLGAYASVSVADVVVIVPTVFVNTAWY